MWLSVVVIFVTFFGLYYQGLGTERNKPVSTDSGEEFHSFNPDQTNTNNRPTAYYFTPVTQGDTQLPTSKSE